MDNVKHEFEQLLNKTEIDYETSEIEQGVMYRFVNESRTGTRIMLGVIFNKENKDVDLELHSPLGKTKAEDREGILELINKLNFNYRYGTFILLDDSQVIIKDSIPLLDVGSDHSQMILEQLFILLKVGENVFPMISEL